MEQFTVLLSQQQKNPKSLIDNSYAPGCDQNIKKKCD